MDGVCDREYGCFLCAESDYKRIGYQISELDEDLLHRIGGSQLNQALEHGEIGGEHRFERDTEMRASEKEKANKQC